MTPNQGFNRTAEQRRCSVPVTLRVPAAGQARRVGRHENVPACGSERLGPPLRDLERVLVVVRPHAARS